jgi:diadenosine tetraphosphatase ApaH/serine/threonine PP2A family protein phosphatase
LLPAGTIRRVQPFEARACQTGVRADRNTQTMRYGLLADIHANREALSACLAELARQGVDRLVFLGDLVGYGADPDWVVDQVMAQVARGAIVVQGNHDISAASEPRKELHADARRAIEWTQGALSAEQRRFLGNLPLTAEAEPDVLFVHASARSPAQWTYITGALDAAQSMQATRARVSFVGHVHEPMLYYADVTGRVMNYEPPASHSIPLIGTRRWLGVVGSAGQPRDGNPAACCAVYDSTSRQYTLLRVPYDHVETARKVAAAGLPQRFADRLGSGH